jgi:hypothetical protein
VDVKFTITLQTKERPTWVGWDGDAPSFATFWRLRFDESENHDGVEA